MADTAFPFSELRKAIIPTKNMSKVSETDSVDHPSNPLLDQGRPTEVGATVPCEIDAGQSSTAADHHFCRQVSQLDEAAQTNDGTAASSAAALQEDSSNFVRIERETFLLFVKVLFKVLEDDPRMRTQATNLVLQCRRRSQRGDPAFQPLMGVVERHLRMLVGETKWRRVHLLVHHRLASVEGELRSTDLVSC